MPQREFRIEAVPTKDGLQNPPQFLLPNVPKAELEAHDILNESHRNAQWKTVVTFPTRCGREYDLVERLWCKMTLRLISR